jgi:hypothetical protein
MGKAKEAAMFSELTAGELETLGDVLHSGALSSGASVSINDAGYDVGLEIFDVCGDVHNALAARLSAQAETIGPEPETEAALDDPEIGS